MEREPQSWTPSPRADGEPDPRGADGASSRPTADEPTPEQEALRAIRNVTEGADPGAEAFALSNAYTDRQLARLGTAWRRLRRGRPPARDAE